jgi:hypothetical protein
MRLQACEKSLKQNARTRSAAEEKARCPSWPLHRSIKVNAGSTRPPEQRLIAVKFALKNKDNSAFAPMLRDATPQRAGMTDPFGLKL